MILFASKRSKIPLHNLNFLEKIDSKMSKESFGQIPKG
ncbi:hypothetical protein DBT_2262 [Dissulfuribacter thermophilus]|uniref:Uncharacterized protein n=1 Tax=Dissulfuribacter thermophilus TaxID=1156395 RepID=A0A1B9F371_9BACT|nr:hypothetical protein DBT_2262 [Dissulfuribacter thermophilus]